MPRVTKAIKEAREAAAAAEYRATTGLALLLNGGMEAEQQTHPASIEWQPSVAVSDVSTSGDEGGGPEDDWPADASMAGGDDGPSGADGTTAQAHAASSTLNHSMYADDSSDDDSDNSDANDEFAGPSSSTAGASMTTTTAAGAKGKREAICRWEDCGEHFGELTRFVDHLHNDHVGNTRTKYACEWTGCSRRGKPQTSRFALLSHLRSHTGEKPFTCPKPECDKSFTRSDALAKHMRVQHDIIPPVSRGGRPPAGGRSEGEGARTSARKSLASVGGQALDEEVLSVASGDGHGYSHRSDDVYYAPGDDINWEGQIATVLPKTNPDAALEIESYKAIAHRLGIQPHPHDAPGGPESPQSIIKILHHARRDFNHKMQHLQTIEHSHPGSSGGAMLSNAQRHDLQQSHLNPNDYDREQVDYDQEDHKLAPLKHACLIESAKLQFAQGENARLCAELERLVQVERVERNEKNRILEEVLQGEIGSDISAIFTPVTASGV